MCRLNTFCCGCTLRAGAITAAILTMIGVVLMVMGAAVFFHAASEEDKKGHSSLAKSHRINGGIYIFSAILGTIIFICLFVAIRQYRAGFVMPWLVCAMIQIVVTGINIILGLVYGSWAILAGLPFLAFFIYLWVVVLNYYRELQGSSGMSTGKV